MLKIYIRKINKYTYTLHTLHMLYIHKINKYSTCALHFGKIGLIKLTLEERTFLSPVLTFHKKIYLLI